jgi:hypothetical protein
MHLAPIQIAIINTRLPKIEKQAIMVAFHPDCSSLDQMIVFVSLES